MLDILIEQENLEYGLAGLLVLDVDVLHPEAQVHTDVVEPVYRRVQERCPAVGFQVLDVGAVITHGLYCPLLLCPDRLKERRLFSHLLCVIHEVSLHLDEDVSELPVVVHDSLRQGRVTALRDDVDVCASFDEKAAHTDADVVFES